MGLVKPFQPDSSSQAPGGSTFLDRMLAKIAESFASLTNAVTNDTLVRVDLDNTRDWPVAHGLGQPVRTWEVVDQDANAVIWRSQAVNRAPKAVILLRASAPVSVLLRFT